jgi:hypothetical protein
VDLQVGMTVLLLIDEGFTAGPVEENAGQQTTANYWFPPGEACRGRAAKTRQKVLDAHLQSSPSQSPNPSGRCYTIFSSDLIGIPSTSGHHGYRENNHATVRQGACRKAIP